MTPKQQEHLEELRQEVLKYEDEIIYGEKQVEEITKFIKIDKKHLAEAEKEFKDYKIEIGLIENK